MLHSVTRRAHTHTSFLRLTETGRLAGPLVTGSADELTSVCLCVCYYSEY